MTKEHEPLVSVVVPVYGVEDYLSDCIQSVLNQSYSNWELILVDDGSLDSSGDICDHFSDADSRVRCIHTENSGLSVARNRGLDVAKGEFVSFIDADDSINSQMIELLVRAMQQTSSSAAVCRVREVSETPSPSETEVLFHLSEPIALLNQDQALEAWLTDHSFRYEVWNKMYRRELISHLRFKPNQVHEDIWFISQLLLRAHSVAVIEYEGYNYLVDRPGSTNSTFDARRFALVEEFEYLIGILVSTGRFRLAEIAQDQYAQFMLTFYKMASANDKTSESTVGAVAQKIRALYPSLKRQSKDSKLLIKYKIFLISPKLYLLLAK